jgi:cysteinyl-tRNA synthetase
MVYNTLSNRKEEFVPLEKGKVRMYCCGPTVYDYFHIGNARAFVVPDVIRRYLMYLGYSVYYAQNLTDIDDKIIVRAQNEGVEFSEIAEWYSKAFFEDIHALGIDRADVYPRATEHVGDIIELIRVLEQKGYTYTVDGSVYYDVTKFENYGCLSNQNLEQLQAGIRIDVDERKKSPADFALWKASKPGEPYWDSPWGPGRPGWHIECSVMSMKYLTSNFDIHCGGADLVFPHHENEIAQSEAATGKQFVKYWIHNGYINIDGEKMSKSLGNILTVRELLKHYSPVVLRFFLISKHYRSPINFSDSEINAAKSAVTRLNNTMQILKGYLRTPYNNDAAASIEWNAFQQELHDQIEKVQEKFVMSMNDDFNTAGAIGAIFEFIRQINSYINSPQFVRDDVDLLLLTNGHNTLEKLCSILGILEHDSGSSKQEDMTDALIQLIVDVRQDVRKRKDWATADMIRDRLAQLGIVLEDTVDGVRWKRT